jgi:hypothetical protein
MEAAEQASARHEAADTAAAVEAAEQALKLRIWGGVGVAGTGEEEVAGRGA